MFFKNSFMLDFLYLITGIIFYINGKEKGKSQPKINEIFTKLGSNLGWSIGRPNDISQLNNYGHLGISHLAYWPRQLTQFEINTAYYETVLSEQKKLRDFIACKSSFLNFTSFIA